MSEAGNARILHAIAIYKFFKVALLLLLTVAAFDFADRGLPRELLAAVARLPVVAGHETLRHFMASASGISGQRFELAGFVAPGYAFLFGIEGFGLWLRRGWAECLTVVSTSGLIPFELWALVEHPTLLRSLLLVLNLVIVAYLAHILWRRCMHSSRGPAAGGS